MSVAKKVLDLIGSCEECPNRSYYSGGVYECSKANTHLPFGKQHDIPEWCPLADYPSDVMQRMNDTITELRQRLEEAIKAQITP